VTLVILDLWLYRNELVRSFIPIYPVTTVVWEPGPMKSGPVTLPYKLVYKSPLCSPCETNDPSKGGLINQIPGQCLVIPYPPIKRVNSSCISGASPTFQVLASFIRLIKGGTYNPTKCRDSDPPLGGDL
jgi:hypothetical protein